MCEREMLEKKVYLLGIGMGDHMMMTEEVKERLRFADCIIGASRMVESALAAIGEMKREGTQGSANSSGLHENTESLGLETYCEYRAPQIAGFIRENTSCKRFAVVFSGDTGFYSGAKKLAEALEEGAECTVEMLPGVSSVSYLASRLNVSWEDAKIVCLHGQTSNYIQSIAYHEKVFLLLGRKGQEEEICGKLNWYGLGETEVAVGKNLSYPEEEIFIKKASELKPKDVEGLAAAMVFHPHPLKKTCVHVPDSAFIRAEAGKKTVPMTKEEIRAAVIAKLGLERGSVLWDVGAGTGSVSIEAALLSEDIRVYAVEKNAEAIALLRENKRKFKTDWVEIVEGTAPAALKNLEAPTHVFIGGSSGNGKEILRTVLKMNRHARIVLTAISLETVKEAMEAMQEGLLPNAEVTQIFVAKSRELGSFHMMMGQNPVYIISAGEKERDPARKESI